MNGADVIEGGFADPVLASQRQFKALMDALSQPGMLQPLVGEAAPPAPLRPGLAEIALTLCDHDTRLWLDAELAASPLVADWLAFHTGTRRAEKPADADFALCTGVERLPRLAEFALGSDEYPDRSTTIVLALPALAGGPGLSLSGPGIRDRRIITPLGMPGDFLAQWHENQQQFPRGIDLLLVGPEGLIGLPRTTRIAREG